MFSRYVIIYRKLNFNDKSLIIVNLTGLNNRLVQFVEAKSRERFMIIEIGPLYALAQCRL